MGIISTSESLYSLSDRDDSIFATKSSSSDNELTHKSKFNDVSSSSSNLMTKSSFCYGNFVKSSTGPLDLNR